MAEDLPLNQDPNLIRPQEEQPPQEDERSSTEHVFVPTEETDTEQAAQASDAEPVHLGSIDHTDSPKDAPTEEYVPSTYVRNKEKAEVMAHAQNDAFDSGEKFPQNTSNHAGIDYDMDVAKNKPKGYEPSKTEKEQSVEKLRIYNTNKRNQVLRYSAAITEHYKEHGDTPSPALEALAAVHELVQDTGYENFEIDTKGDFFAIDSVRVTFDKHEQVIVDYGDWQKNKGEKFTLSMFHGASYEITEEVKDAQDESFDEVLTTKRRRLESVDVERLEEVLAPAIAFRAEQKRQYSEAQHKHYDELDT